MRLLVGLLIVLAITGVIGYFATRTTDSTAVRKKDLRAARRQLAAAEKTINEVRRLALTNLEFQPHLASVVLTTVQEYDDTKQRELA